MGLSVCMQHFAAVVAAKALLSDSFVHRWLCGGTTYCQLCLMMLQLSPVACSINFLNLTLCCMYNYVIVVVYVAVCISILYVVVCVYVL